VQNKINNITIALAGIIQAISLVKELAQTGKVNEVAFQTCIQSIFATHPENATVVFGNLNQIELGLENLLQLYSPHFAANRTTIRQTFAIIRLQKKIARSPKTVSTLRDRIEQAKKQAAYFSLTHPNVLANLGDTYLKAINTFGFRFFILGNQRFLNVRENVDKIRALLLAAVRAAVLWQQMGGSYWQLIFSRKQIKMSAQQLLAELKDQQRNHYVTT